MRELTLAIMVIAGGLLFGAISYYAQPTPVPVPAVLTTPQAVTTTVPTAEVEPVSTVVVSETDGPTPLTEEEFADLQRWLKQGKPLQEWVAKHPDPALKQSTPPVSPPLPRPANTGGHYERRGLLGRRREWVTNQPQTYQPRQANNTGTTACFNCAGAK